MGRQEDFITKTIADMVKSDGDKRQYRGLVLSNGMKIVLVSDSTTDKSATALSVSVGSMSDPAELLGLAHFCEHMLFLGTEKYPLENDYIKYIEHHGGSYNAVTQNDRTFYFFDIAPDNLDGALDRFSQFFIAPLYTESATDREINAVNSEFEGYVKDDGWRQLQLDKHLANSTHDYSKFIVGNTKTLSTIPKEKGINVRNELLKFHDKWYSSNIMQLVILGKESLDELENTVVNLFSGVKTQNIEAPKWPNHPFGEKQFCTYYYVTPIKNIRTIQFTFPSPYMDEFYKAAPTRYISSLVGHEGPGSLLSVLKDKGWATNLQAGSSGSTRGFDFFCVWIEATEESLDHVDDIAKLFFQYMNMLKSLGPQKWYYEELKEIGEISFKFKDKEEPQSYVLTLASNLQDIPFEDVLGVHYLLSEWRPDLIEEAWSHYIPRNIRVDIVSKKFENETTETEPWFGTKYRQEKISDEVLMSWEKAGFCEKLKFPEKNEYIPDNFDLYPLEEDMTKYPVIIKDTPITRVWFKQDDEYLLPKANLVFNFASQMASLNPMCVSLNELLVDLLTDDLNEDIYAASLADLSWWLSSKSDGIELQVDGYNDKQHVLLEKIMENIINFKIDPKRFAVYKDNFVRNLKNFAMEQPWEQTEYYSWWLLVEREWPRSEMLRFAENITMKQLEDYIPQMFSNIHIECLIHGNVNKERALQLVNIVEDRLTAAFNISPLMVDELTVHRGVKLEDGCDYLYTVENDTHKSSSVEITFQYDVETTENNMLIKLFQQIIIEPCFNVLRTKEQLGYVVLTQTYNINGAKELKVCVQSERHPLYLNNRIEEFLRNMLTYIEEMSEEDFTKNKEALAVRKLEKPKSLSGLFAAFWSEIRCQTYHFERDEVEVDYLRTLSKQDIIDFYNDNLKENAPKRKKLSVHIVSMTPDGAGKLAEKESEVEASSATEIHDISAFKSSHELYPLPKMYRDISRKGLKF